MELDSLDFAVLEELHERPRAGVLELSRRLQIARATVAARLKKLQDGGVIAGYEPRLDVGAAGFGVQAFATLEIAQGALDSVTDELGSIPGVLEAFATTGAGDVLCRIAAASHIGLQQVLLELNRSGVVVRSTSVVVLSVLIPFRTLPLLRTLDTGKVSKAPAHRGPRQ